MYRRLLSVLHFSKWRFVAIGGFVGLVMLAQMSRVEFDRYATHSPRVIRVQNRVRHAFNCYKSETHREHGGIVGNTSRPYLPEIIEKCAGSLEPLLELQEIKPANTNDVIFIVPGLSFKFIYTMMTIGIDKNIESEIAVIDKYPYCDRFVGVDATAKVNKDLVEGIGGKFLNYQVVQNATTPSIHSSNFTSNKTVSVPSVDLAHVFEAAEMQYTVDVLNLNIHNGESFLFEELISKLENYPKICQLNVKFNKPDDTMFLELLYRASTFHHYLLIKCVPTTKCFFLNVRDVYCVGKYAKSLFH